MQTTINQSKPPYGMMAILLIGGFISFLNNTLLNIALPAIMTEFSVKPSQVQWLSTGYMLVSGILIPASAYFIQRFTNRQVFIVAMSFFSLGTFLAMLAPNFSLLIVARMIQAVGSSMIMPLLMNILLAAFPIEKRGTAMGMLGLVMFAAPAIGPTLSGYIVEHYSWRMLFTIILPIALVSLIYAVFRLKNVTEQRKVQFDIRSLMLSTIGFGGILYGFSSAGTAAGGWQDPLVYGTISIGVVAIVLFIHRQLRLEEPLLDFRIYRYPMFALASAISVVLSISMFAGMILTPLYVQTIRGISPVDSGLLMLPGALLMGGMSPIVGRLFDKYGAKTLAITGLVITTVMTYYLSRLSMDSGYYFIMLIYTVRMLGISLVMMPVMTNGLNQLPMKSNPHGTAMNNTLQQVSGAIGTALLLTIMTNHTEIAVQQLVVTMPEASEQQVFLAASLEGVQHSFLIATGFVVFALILALFIKRSTPVALREE